MSRSRGASVQGIRRRSTPAGSATTPLERADRIAARPLRVHAAPPGKANFTDEGWPFQTPVIVSAVRCTLRYVFLPFAVPLIGIASGAALSILLVLDVIAAIAIITTLRRLWRVQHASRWQYLLLAMGLALLLGVFFVTDITVIGV